MLNKMNEDLEIIYNEIQLKLLPRNIKKGITILGIEGTLEKSENAGATYDGNLDPKYLLTGYTAIVDDEIIVGTMPQHGAKTIIPSSNDVKIPEGHYDSLSIPIINAANCTDYSECNQAILSI